MASLRSLGQLAPKLCQRNRNYPLNNLIKSVLISTTKKSKDNAVSKTIIEGEMEHIDRDPNEPVEIPKVYLTFVINYLNCLEYLTIKIILYLSPCRPPCKGCSNLGY